jgi:hypothetical protein
VRAQQAPAPMPIEVEKLRENLFLREYSDFNRDFRNAVFEAKKSGRIPDQYKGYGAPNPVLLRANVENI